MLKPIVAGIAFALISTSPAGARTGPDTHQSVLHNADRAIGELPNGVRYLVERRSGAATRVLLHVGAGSLAEKPTEVDVSHLVEHLAFSETRNFPRGAFKRLMSRIGASYQGNAAAYATRFWMDIPTDTHLESKDAMQVLRDWADGVIIDNRTVDLERNIMASEAGSWNNWRKLLLDRSRVQDMFVGTAMAELPDNWSSLRIPASDVQAFYRKWYRPSLMQVIVVGDVDVNEWVNAIRAKMSDIRERSDNKAPPPRMKPLALPEMKRVTLIRAQEPTNPVIETFLIRPRQVASSQAELIRDELRSLLAARIIKHRGTRLNSGNGIIVDVNTDGRFSPFKKADVVHLQITGLQAEPGRALNDAALDQASLIHEMRVNPVTIDELNLARIAALAEIAKASDVSAVIVRRYTEALDEGLNLDDSTGPVDQAMKRHLLSQLTLADVQRFIQAIFTSEPYTVITAYEPEIQGTNAEALSRVLKTARFDGVPSVKPAIVQGNGFAAQSHLLPGEGDGWAPFLPEQQWQTIVLPDGRVLILARAIEREFESGPILRAIGNLPASSSGSVAFSGPVEIRPDGAAPEQLRAFLAQYEISTAMSGSATRAILDFRGAPGSEEAMFALMRTVMASPSNLAPVTPVEWKVSLAGTEVPEAERSATVQRQLANWRPNLFILSSSIDAKQATRLALGNLGPATIPDARKCSLNQRIAATNSATPRGGLGANDESKRTVSIFVTEAPNRTCVLLLTGIMQRMAELELRTRLGLAYSPTASSDIHAEEGGRFRIEFTISTGATAPTQDALDAGIMRIFQALAAGKLDTAAFEAEKSKLLRDMLAQSRNRKTAVDEVQELLLNQHVPSRYLEGYLLDSIKYKDLAAFASQLFAGLQSTPL